MKRAVSLLIPVMLIAACGGDDDDGQSVASSIVGEDAQSEQEEGDGGAGDQVEEVEEGTSSEGDQAIAEAAVLKLSDFEPGWRIDDDDDDDEDEELDCPGLEELEDDDGPSAESENFTRDQSFVANFVGIGKDEEEAVATLDLLREDATTECLREELQATFEEEPDFGEDFDEVSSEVGALSVGNFGDDAAGIQFVFSLEGDINLDIYMDLITVRRGRAVSLFIFADVFSPSGGERDYLIEAVDARLVESGV